MSKNLGNMEILQAEAYTLRDGLNSIDHLSNNSIVVEGDSKILIDVVNGSFNIPWRIKAMVKDITLLKERFNHISFCHVWREANFVADKLANFGSPPPFNNVLAQCLAS